MRHAALLLLPALALAACDVRSGGDNRAAANEANAAAGDTTPEGPSMAAQLFGGGRPQPLQVQKVLANGVVLSFGSIQAKPTETVLAVKIVNGHQRDVELNWSDKKTFLVAGGQKFYISPPLDNQDVRVTAGSTLEGELVFLGALPREGQVSLVINEGLSDSQYTSTPGVTIPLPITAAAFSDDGSKKKLSSLKFGGDLARTSLRAAAAGASNLAAGAGGASNLNPVEAIKSELGATETDRGTLIALPGDVLFDFDKATIREAARPTLDKLAELIKAQNPPSIAIEGHTDSKGNDRYNQRLSEQRATSVRDYLISVRTVDGTKLKTKGLGELRPVAPNSTPAGGDDEAGRQKNRRVEVVLGK